MPPPRAAVFVGLAVALATAGRGAATSMISLSREGPGAVNVFGRDPLGTAHALATWLPGHRLILAIPEENTGVGVWFRAPAEPDSVKLELTGPLRFEEVAGGVRISIAFAAGTPRLAVQDLLVGSVRTLRDRSRNGQDTRAPTLRAARDLLAGHPAFDPLTARIGARLAPAHLVDGGVELSRPTLDGRHRLRARLVPTGATRAQRRGAQLSLEGPGRVQGRLELTHDLPLLAPLVAKELLSPEASRTLARAPATTRQTLERMRDELSLLAYEQKFLAGSWRFLTYFGRDTLLTLRMLAPVLSDRALAAGLAGVLERTSPLGWVAHEEDLGDQAAYARLAQAVALAREGREDAARLALLRELPRLGEPLHDYHMVDDDLMVAGLATVVAERLGPAGWAAFLGRPTPHGDTLGDALERQLGYLMDRLEGPWIPLRGGSSVGDWRDSQEGLGHRPFAFSVNGALPEAALAALGRLPRGPLPAGLASRLEPAALAALRRVWRQRRDSFLVSLDSGEVRRRLDTFLATLPPRVAQALATAVPRGPIRFHALALDADLRPMPVMHSDAALLLLDVPPWDLDEEELAVLLGPFRQPFPLGLDTPAGFLVANPALSGNPELQALFDRRHYHGTVIWGWQIALLESALLRWGQDPRLTGGRLQLWRALQARLEALRPALAGIRHEELWAWRVAPSGALELAPYGVDAESATESNALQLWSQAPLAAEILRLRR